MDRPNTLGAPVTYAKGQAECVDTYLNNGEEGSQLLLVFESTIH